MEKGKKSGSGRGYISWNDDMDKALLDTFVEYYNKGDRCQNGWKSHVYTAAIKNIREKCNVEITKDNIMSRNKTFDKHHTITNGMLETSGFCWDWNKNKISVDSDFVSEAYVGILRIEFVESMDSISDLVSNVGCSTVVCLGLIVAKVIQVCFRTLVFSLAWSCAINFESRKPLVSACWPTNPF
ncbi:hypothetical protein GUJ93_ZPchr0006g41210 [Zizania palustris]|uniref:Myb/SANT-like domain-containing protein n=1 Tax=Zizania palustris TaxID=103762 RepID=A0A8J5SNP0_ZIZPA|nr:hypothetical protein GUJ93_ZPchr0006g41210 [Zizania palustris]